MCHYQISLTVGYALYVGNRDHIRLMSTENCVFLLRAAFGPSAQSAWSSRFELYLQLFLMPDAPILPVTTAYW